MLHLVISSPKAILGCDGFSDFIVLMTDSFEECWLFSGDVSHVFLMIRLQLLAFREENQRAIVSLSHPIKDHVSHMISCH